MVRSLVTPIRWALDEAKGGRSELRFDAGARGLWEEFYRGNAGVMRLGLACKMTARHETHVARNALLYATVDRSHVVTRQHLESGIALADYGRRSVIWAFGDSTGNRHADELRQMLRDLGSDAGISWESAKGELGIKHAADMTEVVNVLVEAGIAECWCRFHVPAARVAGHHARSGQRVLRVQTPYRARTRDRADRIHDPCIVCSV